MPARQFREPIREPCGSSSSSTAVCSRPFSARPAAKSLRLEARPKGQRPKAQAILRASGAFGISVAALRGKSRSPAAECEVNGQTDDKPDEEAYPGFKR